MSPKVQGFQGSRYLKLTFKYELDSKEGPSCFNLKSVFTVLRNHSEFDHTLHSPNSLIDSTKFGSLQGGL